MTYWVWSPCSFVGASSLGTHDPTYLLDFNTTDYSAFFACASYCTCEPFCFDWFLSSCLSDFALASDVGVIAWPTTKPHVKLGYFSYSEYTFNFII